MTELGEWASKKNRKLDGSKILEGWKEQWAITVNRKLEADGFEERIDHRSNDEQGKFEKALIHEGKLISGIRRKLKLNKGTEVEDYIDRNPEATAYYKAIVDENNLRHEYNRRLDILKDENGKISDADKKLLDRDYIQNSQLPDTEEKEQRDRDRQKQNTTFKSSYDKSDFEKWVEEVEQQPEREYFDDAEPDYEDIELEPPDLEPPRPRTGQDRAVIDA